MKIFVPSAVCFLYLVAVIGLGPLLGPVASPWVDALLSLLFLLAYRWFVRGRLSVPLAVIFCVTIVFPVSVLFAIGMPVYHSWSNTAASLFAAFRDYGQLWGLELFVPLFAAATGALVLRWRSNLSFKRDALKRAP